MTRRELIIYMVMTTFLVGVTSLLITLYGAVTWDHEVVTWAGSVFLVSCIVYGCLTKWSEKDVH